MLTDVCVNLQIFVVVVVVAAAAVVAPYEGTKMHPRTCPYVLCFRPLDYSMMMKNFSNTKHHWNKKDVVENNIVLFGEAVIFARILLCTMV
jgi:hypothetical protein